VRVGDDYSEFISAQSGHQIGLPHRVPKTATDLNQQLIANRMAEAVVDDLEVVKVKVKNGELLVRAGKSQKRTFKAFKEGQSIRQTRQLVFTDFSFGFDLLADALDNLRRVDIYAAS
jgi:hypothetical protein